MNPLRRIRQKLGLTQTRLAEVLDVSQSNVSHYENGRQSIPPRIARRLVNYVKQQGKRLSFNDIYSTEEGDRA